MEEGEKYLNITLWGGQIKIAAFPNAKKEKPTDPDFVGSGVAVWVNKKKEKTKTEQVDVLI